MSKVTEVKDPVAAGVELVVKFPSAEYPVPTLLVA